VPEAESVVLVESFHEERNETGGDVTNPFDCIVVVQDVEGFRVDNGVEPRGWREHGRCENLEDLEEEFIWETGEPGAKCGDGGGYDDKWHRTRYRGDWLTAHLERDSVVMKGEMARSLYRLRRTFDGWRSRKAREAAL